MMPPNMSLPVEKDWKTLAWGRKNGRMKKQEGIREE